MQERASAPPDNLVRQDRRLRLKIDSLFDLSGTDDAEACISPERVLVMRVVHQAIRDAVEPRPKPKPGHPVTANMKTMRRRWLGNRTEARWWILDEHDHDGARPFSLEWCCEELGISAANVRHRARVTFGLVTDWSVKPYLCTSAYEMNGRKRCRKY